MKTGEALIQLLIKYELRRETPAEVRDRMLFSKKKIHREIINKKTGSEAVETGGLVMNRYKGIIASAAAVVLIAAGALLLTVSGYFGDRTADENITAKAVFVKGTVSVTRGGNTIVLKSGETVNSGDRVVTGADSYAVLQINETGTVKLNAGTECVFSEIFSEGNTEIKLSNGSVYSNLRKLGKNQNYMIKTPTCTASVRGTEFLTIAGNKEDGVRVLEGTVNVSTAASSADVTELKGVKISSAGVINEYSLNEIEVLQLKKESLFDYIENLKGTDQQSLDTLLGDIDGRIIQLDEEIAKLEGDASAFAKLSPLDRLRKMNKPLTMIYLRDGSQIAGSAAGQKNGIFRLDTGEGVIEIPVSDIVKRLPMK